MLTMYVSLFTLCLSRDQSTQHTHAHTRTHTHTHTHTHTRTHTCRELTSSTWMVLSWWLSLNAAELSQAGCLDDSVSEYTLFQHSYSLDCHLHSIAFCLFHCSMVLYSCIALVDAYQVVYPFMQEEDSEGRRSLVS